MGRQGKGEAAPSTHSYSYTYTMHTGAFLCPFQDGSLDLDFPPSVFYARRQAKIEARLAQLASMDGAALAGAYSPVKRE